MINYSVYMMLSPMDRSGVAKAYAKSQVNEIWTLEKFCQHIADHNGVFSRGTVKGVLTDMCECLVEQLLNGNKVQLGELGTFGVSLSSEGAANVASFTANNIKEVNLVFTPGKDFENMISKATFNLVTSRAIQAATLKAVKTNQTSVDLTNLGSSSDAGSGTGSTGTGGSSDTGSSSDSGSDSGSDSENPYDPFAS